MKIKILLLISALISVNGVQDARLCAQNYWDLRDELIARDTRLDYAGNLTWPEEIVDRFLSYQKSVEFNAHRGFFPPSHNFLYRSTRERIDASEVLNDYLFGMPKGGNLHLHLSAGVEIGTLLRIVKADQSVYDVWCGRNSSVEVPRLYFAPECEVGDWRVKEHEDYFSQERIVEWITLGPTEDGKYDGMESGEIWSVFQVCLLSSYMACLLYVRTSL